MQQTCPGSVQMTEKIVLAKHRDTCAPYNRGRYLNLPVRLFVLYCSVAPVGLASRDKPIALEWKVNGKLPLVPLNTREVPMTV